MVFSVTKEIRFGVKTKVLRIAEMLRKLIVLLFKAIWPFCSTLSVMISKHYIEINCME
jgi:hypothetical protein